MSEHERSSGLDQAASSSPDDEPQSPEGRSASPWEVVGKTRYHQMFQALFEIPSEPPTLGRYVVLKALGRGGMGTVLEVFDRTLDRKVAVKVLHQGLNPRYTERLVREAQALAKLSHPNVVQVYEAGEIGGRAFVAMELIKGQTLRRWMEREPPPTWRECVEMFVALGDGLVAAHAQGLVHRDFKPANAIVDEQGRPRVLDFGLARRVDEVDEGASPGPSASPGGTSRSQSSLDTSGAMLGTLGYMPPEQMDGGEVDARSDQFSLCVTLWEAVHGQRPFEGRSPAALLESVRRGPRPVPSGSGAPAELRKVLRRGLAFDPSERWPSTEDLLVELRRLVAPRRRRWLAAVGVAVGLSMIGAGLGVERYAVWASRCTGAAVQLAGIWDEVRRREVEASILGTEAAHAPDTWARVKPRLDDYAAAWIHKHTEVCEATRVTEEQTEEHMGLRMSCLQQERTALRATVDVLARGDETIVERAVRLLDGLPSPTRCDDVQALQLALPPPDDPAAAGRVEALRERLARARALDGAGAYDEALTEAQAVIEQVEPIGYEPLEAEARLILGLAWLRTDHIESAVQEVERAYAIAARIGHEAVEAMAPRVLVFAVGLRLHDHEAGLQWGKVALPLSQRRGAEPDERAKALHQMGRVFFDQRRLQEALDHYHEALELRIQRLGPRHLDVADSHDAVGVTLNRQGKRDEGLRHLQDALEIKRRVLGPHHPAVGSTLSNVADALKDQGRVEEALDHYRRALAIFEALGPRHLRVGLVLNNIGVSLKLQGKMEEALDHYRRSLSIKEEHLGPDHLDVALTLNNIGSLLLRTAEGSEARPYYRRSLEIKENVLGPRHPDLAPTLLGLAVIAADGGDLVAARAHAERAVSIREQGEVSLDLVAEARFNLALVLWHDPTQRVRARVLAEQARDDYTAAGPSEARWLAEVERWLTEHPTQ